MHADMGVWGWWMVVLMPLLWIGLPTLIASAIWAAGRPRRKPTIPLDLLKESYARGQITHDQVQQAKRDLA